jgi:cell division septal protein FtsQ
MLLIAAGIAVALNPSWIRIESVQVDLANSSHEDLLFQRIRKSLEPQFKYLEGKYFWQVPLKQVYEITSKDRRVKRLSVRREFPSQVWVEIEPYTPVLAYLSGDGRIYPVATDATLLPALAPSDAPDLPFLRGEDFKDEPKLREAAIDLYNTLPDDGALSKKTVSEIYYSKKDGFEVYVSGQTSDVKMGDTDFGPKISRVQKVLSYLDSQNIKGRVIDARFSKKVVVRVRKAP